MSIFRDAVIGSIIRAAGGRKLLRYPEEEAGFKLPDEWRLDSRADNQSPSASPSSSANPNDDLQQQEHSQSKHITTVSWYAEDDPDNPYNWSRRKTTWVSTLLFAYTFAAYVGASIYVPGIPGIVEDLETSQTVASLGVVLYVLAYGAAPLVLSPLSEIPAIGRNPPYAITFSLFAVLSIPTALVDNISGLLVVRFLLGLFCSPALATGGASYGDFFAVAKMPYVIALWGGGATLAPALGPVLSAYAVQYKGWQWSSWELSWLSIPIAILMVVALPETSSDTILLRRAQRLRKITGRQDLRAECERSQAKMKVREIAFDALIKPWEINARDPAVLFSTFYLALTYGVYYSFFESFPLVFGDLYGFSTGSLGLAFLSILVGLVIAVALLCAYIKFISPRRLGKFDVVPPEAHMWPGLFATLLIPIGLFIFAWTADSSIHWVACMSGVSISMCGIFIVTQCIFIYIPFTYPRYSGSLFAANGFARSALAGAAILFSPPMFDALGISGGVSLLAGCSVLCTFGMYGLYFYGARLREKSSFALA